MTRGRIIAGKAAIIVSIEDQVEKGLKSVKSKLGKLSTSLSDIGGDLFRGGLVGSIGGGLILRDFQTFEDKILFLGTKLRDGFAGVPDVERKIRQLGRSTSFTAQEVADAASRLAQAGFSAQEVIGALQATLDLARGSLIDLDSASTLVSDTIRTFGLRAEDAASVADKFLTAARLGTVTVDQLRESLKEVSGTFVGLNVNLDDALALITALASRNLKATKAGTNLNTALLNLTANADFLLDEFGIGIADTADEFEKITLIVQRLSEEFNKLAGVPRTIAIQRVFNIRGGRAIQAILPRDQVAALLDFSEEIKKSGGFAREAAKTLDKGFGGAVRRATSALESLRITLGETVQGPFVKLLDVIPPISNRLEVLTSKYQNLLTIIAISIPSALLLGASFITFGFALRKLLGPLSLVQAGIGGLFSFISFNIKGVLLAVALLEKQIKRISLLDFNKAFGTKTVGKRKPKVVPITLGEAIASQLAKPIPFVATVSSALNTLGAAATRNFLKFRNSASLATSSTIAFAKTVIGLAKETKTFKFLDSLNRQISLVGVLQSGFAGLGVAVRNLAKIRSINELTFAVQLFSARLLQVSGVGRAFGSIQQSARKAFLSFQILAKSIRGSVAALETLRRSNLGAANISAIISAAQVSIAAEEKVRKGILSRIAVFSREKKIIQEILSLNKSIAAARGLLSGAIPAAALFDDAKLRAFREALTASEARLVFLGKAIERAGTPLSEVRLRLEFINQAIRRLNRAEFAIGFRTQILNAAITLDTVRKSFGKGLLTPNQVALTPIVSALSSLQRIGAEIAVRFQKIVKVADLLRFAFLNIGKARSLDELVFGVQLLGRELLKVTNIVARIKNAFAAVVSVFTGIRVPNVFGVLSTGLESFRVTLPIVGRSLSTAFSTSARGTIVGVVQSFKLLRLTATTVGKAITSVDYVKVFLGAARSIGALAKGLGTVVKFVAKLPFRPLLLLDVALLIGFLRKFISPLDAFLKTFEEGFAKAFSIIGSLGKNFEDSFSFLKAGFGLLRIGDTEAGFEALKTAVTSLVSSIKNKLLLAWLEFTNSIQGTITFIKDLFTAIFEFAKLAGNLFLEVFGQLADAGSLLGNLFQSFAGGKDAQGPDLSAFFDPLTIAEVLGQILTTIASGIVSAIQGIGNLIGQVIIGITGLGRTFIRVFRSFFDALSKSTIGKQVFGEDTLLNTVKSLLVIETGLAGVQSEQRDSLDEFNTTSDQRQAAIQKFFDDFQAALDARRLKRTEETPQPTDDLKQKQAENEAKRQEELAITQRRLGFQRLFQRFGPVVNDAVEGIVEKTKEILEKARKKEVTADPIRKQLPRLAAGDIIEAVTGTAQATRRTAIRVSDRREEQMLDETRQINAGIQDIRRRRPQPVVFAD